MILVVRHGAGRGRLPGYMQGALGHLERRRPYLLRELRLWETGGAPPSLTGVRAVVFWLADPLERAYPECFAQASLIEKEAEQRGLTLVNPPSSLSNSIKSVQARLWRAAGIPTPPVRRYADAAELEALLAEASFPVLLRGDELHGQSGMRLYQDRTRFETVLPGELPCPGGLSPLVDLRAEYRSAGRRSVWSRFHHKRRSLVLGCRVVPYELLFSASPVVGSATCTFSRHHGDPSPIRQRLREALARERACRRADLEFAERGDAHGPLLQRAAAALGLGWAALDYAVGADGRAVLWEANPYFALPPAWAMYQSRPRRIRRRYHRVYDAIGDFLGELTGGE